MLTGYAQGDARAQYNLGVMYGNGQGVAQNYAEALKWYKLAAAQGDARAQFNLALMYDKGQGVAQNYVKAHMWFNLVAVSGDNDAIEERVKVARRMTAQQIAQAQQMASACQASHYKNCD